jgi:uncharacterized Zn-binding protein involved in type VI secretion
VAIPDKILEKTGEVVGTATQNGAGLTQDPNSHWYDVMTNTGAGLADHVGNGDAQYIATHAVPGIGIVDSSVRIGQALGRDWESSDFDGVRDGMSQQAGVVAEQAASIWNGTTPDGKPLSTFQRVGAAFGLLSSVEQLVTMPLGMIPFPALPALRIMDMDIGLPHAHMHPPNLTPPNPVPVPLPSTGPVIPIPILSGASKVVVNNMPAARCGDMGLGVWCGGYFPMYEVFLGSSNVWIEGNRAARVGVDITKHCIFSAPKPNDPPLGPMFGTTINCSPNVVIGGIPLPSLTSMAMGAAFKALFKGVGKVLGAARRRLGRGPKPPAPRTTGARPPGPPPIPHAHFKPRLSPWAESVADSLPTGGRVPIREVNAAELAAMTRTTGDEFAVVVDEAGQLQLVRGTPEDVPLQAGDHLLVHTHPPGDIASPSNADLSNAAFNQQHYGWDHPQAVIGPDGNVRYYDQNGIINNPNSAMVPVDSNGNINGMHSPGGRPGGPMGAIPPAQMNPGQGPYI